MSDLGDLSAKLDGDRLEFLRTEIRLSFTLSEMAETEYDIGEREAGDRSLAHSEHGYATLRRFLTDPKHTRHLTQDQFQELNDGVQNLRQRLDDVRRLHTPR
jgi:hypothetical protein